MKLIVGLGNPGLTYARTRHNAGFLAVQTLAARHRLRWQRRQPVWVTETRLDGEAVVLALPQTFMNHSGQAVAHLQRCYGMRGPADWLMVCDEVQLSLGRIRLRGAGSAGGHHGLAAAIEALGTTAVARLRIGVGPGPAGDVSDYVLERFPRAEWRLMATVLPRAAAACALWVTAGMEAAMNQYNVKATNSDA